MSRRFKLPDPTVVIAAPGPTPSGLTESNVPFAGPNGRLIDENGFSYSNVLTKLTVPNLDVSGTLIVDEDITSLESIDAGDGAVVMASNGDFGASYGTFAIVGGKVTVYNNVPVEGLGIPAILDDVALTAQAAVIGSTNFTNAGAAGTYKLVYYLVCTTADATAGSIRLDVTANDGTAARTLTGTAIALTATNRTTKFTNAESDGSLIKLGSGSVAYTVVLVSGAINAARFSLYASLMRLS